MSFPSIGLFIAVVWLVSDLMREVRWKKEAFAIGGGAILLILCFLTEIQVGYWKNSETLFRHAIVATERNYLGYCNLGPILVEQGKLSEAEKAYKKALEIWPSYADAHNNLGVLRGMQGRYEGAIRHYKDALQANPKHMTARTNLARLFSEQGYLDKANLHYDKALQIKPDSFVAHNGKGLVLARMNKMEDAIKSFRKGVELCPICAEACNNLGRALMLKAEYEEAIENLRRALQLRPAYAEAYNNLGLVYVRKGDLENPAPAAYSSMIVQYETKEQALDDLVRLYHDYQTQYEGGFAVYHGKNDLGDESIVFKLKFYPPSDDIDFGFMIITVHRNYMFTITGMGLEYGIELADVKEVAETLFEKIQAAPLGHW